MLAIQWRLPEDTPRLSFQSATFCSSSHAFIPVLAGTMASSPQSSGGHALHCFGASGLELLCCWRWWILLGIHGSNRFVFKDHEDKRINMIQAWYQQNQGGYLSLNHWRMLIEALKLHNMVLHRVEIGNYAPYIPLIFRALIGVLSWCNPLKCWRWDVFSKWKSTSSHTHKRGSYFPSQPQIVDVHVYCCQGHQAFNNVDPNLRADLPRCSDGQPQSLCFFFCSW